MTPDETPPPAARRAGRPTPGLTLLEIMVVIAIVGVLGAMALPSAGAMLQRHRLAAVAEQLAADLAEARFQSAQRGQAFHVLPQAGAGNAWCWTVATVPGCACGEPASCGVKQVSAVDHPGVRLGAFRPFELAPSGSAAGVAEGFAEFESPAGERLRVELAPLGRARVCRPDAAAAAVTRHPRC